MLAFEQLHVSRGGLSALLKGPSVVVVKGGESFTHSHPPPRISCWSGDSNCKSRPRCLWGPMQDFLTSAHIRNKPISLITHDQLIYQCATSLSTVYAFNTYHIFIPVLSQSHQHNMIPKWEALLFFLILKRAPNKQQNVPMGYGENIWHFIRLSDTCLHREDKSSVWATFVSSCSSYSSDHA